METLFSRENIARRIAEMGREIGEFYTGKDLTVIVLMNGGAFFGCDLVREMDIPLWFDSLRAASYVADTRGEKVDIASELKLSPANRHILLVDDVFDSGNTIKACREHLLACGAVSVRSAVLVDKKVPGRESKPDWAGFPAPDKYLIGFGLDSHEFYRNLPEIAAI